MKKPDGHILMMLGVGKKPSSGLSGPPPMPRSAAAPAPAPATDDEPPGAPEVEPDADDSGVDWDDALDYHDSSESCGQCSHMPEDPQQPCPIVRHPVDPQGGHCEAFSGQQQEQEGQEMPAEQEMTQ